MNKKRVLPIVLAGILSISVFMTNVDYIYAVENVNFDESDIATEVSSAGDPATDSVEDSSAAASTSADDTTTGSSEDSSAVDTSGVNEEYTITFDANGGAFADGETVETIKAAKGKMISELPEEPTMEGYDFEGWSEYQEGEKELLVDVKSIPAEDVTLYASWKESDNVLLTQEATGGNFGNLTWNLSDKGVLTITGTGSMNSIPWSSNKAQITKVDIKDGVTNICGSAFSSCTSLTEVSLASSVDTISDSAFSGDIMLNSVSIPNVRYIGPNAFWSCTALKTISLPGVQTIESSAFYGCVTLTSVTFSDNLKTLGYNSFEGCTSLNYIIIPKSLTECDSSGPFCACTSLTNVTFESGITIIPSYVLSGVSNINSITIPSSVTSIGRYAFYNCSSLVSVNIPAKVNTIDVSAFRGCSGMQSVSFGTSVKKINYDAFSGCSSLSTVNYKGTKKDWDSINIDKYGNGYLIGAHCNYIVGASDISISDDSAVIGIGGSKTLTATVTPDNAHDKTVTWTSSNTAIATVDSNGLVTAISAGDAVITCTANDGGYAATCDIYVVEKETVKALISADPESGSEVADGTEVLLSCDQNKAKIYYTTDNSDPTITSTCYSSSKPVEVTGSKGSTFTVKAIAVKEGMNPSEIQQFSYTIGTTVDAWGDITQKDKAELNNDTSNIPSGLWIAGVPSDVNYTGKANVFSEDAIHVYDGNRILTIGTDYTVKYINNINAYTVDDENSGSKRTPTITVTGKGNYTGSSKKSFYINPVDVSDLNDEVETYTIYEKYDGKLHKSKPIVSWNGRTLTGSEYTVSYPDLPTDKIEARNSTAYKAAGQYKVRITGKGNFAGSRDVKLVITDTSAGEGTTLLGQLRVSGKIPDQQYKGNGVDAVNKETLEQYFTGGTAAKVKLTDSTRRPAKTLTYGTDYEVVSIRNAADVGKASAVIEGKGSYSGTIEVNFKIVQSQPISRAKIDIKSSYVYTGSEIDPVGDISLGNGTTGLRPYFMSGREKSYLTYTAGAGTGNDFSYTITDDINAGKATLTITGNGAYEGTLVKTFKITQLDISKVPSDSISAVLESTNIPYTKGGETPNVTVSIDHRNLVQDVDYTVSCSGKDAAGSYRKVIIIGKGNYKGRYTLNDKVMVVSQNISMLNLSSADKIYTGRSGAWKSNPVVTDTNGKALRAGTDYTVSYSYDEGTIVSTKDGKKIKKVYRRAGDEIMKNDNVPAGAVIKVTITGKGNYAAGVGIEQVLVGRYNIVKADISKARMTVDAQVYSGKPICPVKTEPNPQDSNKPVIKLSGAITTDDYEITGYSNNINKGTATVTVRGVGNYGGTKKITFKIGTKKLLWWVV
jgi:uncharacterized repeat protein (TIGR02543 family)